MTYQIRTTILTLSLICGLFLPAAAQVQGRSLPNAGNPKVVWSRTFQAQVGQIPRLAFENSSHTFYQVEVFTLDSPVRMGISDQGGRLRARADLRKRQGSHRGRPVYLSSFSYNPHYQGQYQLRVAGYRGQRFTYRVTKYRLPQSRVARGNGLTVNQSRQRYTPKPRHRRNTGYGGPVGGGYNSGNTSIFGIPSY